MPIGLRKWISLPEVKKPMANCFESVLVVDRNSDSLQQLLYLSSIRYHFANERFSESQQLLTGRWRRIAQAGQAGDYRAALQLLGLSLTAIQDFYSHTNWVELGNTEFNPDIGNVASKE